MAQPARIFISHSHQDAQWCRAFVEALRASEADIWYDEHNLNYGQLMDEIERELRSRPIFIVALSPAAVASQWVRREMEAAILLRSRDSKRIILPIIAAKCDVPILWDGFKRVSGPTDEAVPPREGAQRILRALALVPPRVDSAPVPPLESETADAATRRGQSLIAQDRSQEALTAFERALLLNPLSVQAWIGVGAVAAFQQRYQESLIALRRALDLDPNNAFAWALNGEILRSLGRYSEALIALERALTLDPEFAQAWTSTSVLLMMLGRYSEALVAADHALRLGPSLEDAWRSRVECLERLGRTSEAAAARAHQAQVIQRQRTSH